MQYLEFLLVNFTVSFYLGMAALGSALGEVYVFYLDLDNKLNLVFTLQANAAFGPVRVVRFNDNGQILVTGHDVGALEVSFLTYCSSNRCPCLKLGGYRVVQTDRDSILLSFEMLCEKDIQRNFENFF